MGFVPHKSIDCQNGAYSSFADQAQALVEKNGGTIEVDGRKIQIAPGQNLNALSEADKEAISAAIAGRGVNIDANGANGKVAMSCHAQTSGLKPLNLMHT